ncbi:hypothetical protein [Arthrobacter antioxidans]|nr:hypothetical protein [Arthrobacter antioxidans]
MGRQSPPAQERGHAVQQERATPPLAALSGVLDLGGPGFQIVTP